MTDIVCEVLFIRYTRGTRRLIDSEDESCVASEIGWGTELGQWPFLTFDRSSSMGSEPPSDEIIDGDDDETDFASMGIWMAIGIAIGVAIGATMNNVGLGIVLGVVFGAAMGVYQSQRD